MGNRRNLKRNDINKDLPKYIYCYRNKSNEIKNYYIDSFPIGIEKKELLKKITFSVKNYESSEKCLQAAKKHLDELKKEYSHIHEKISINKESAKKEKIITKKTEIPLNELPKYVYPLYHPDTKNKIGYYVEGVPDNDGKPYPKKEFTDKKTNKWNLFQANEYIKQCLILNKDSIFNVPDSYIKNDPSLKSRQRKYNDDDNNLPKYVSIIRQNGTKIGYNIAIPSLIKSNGKKFTKKFANKKLSMEDKLRACLDTLESIKIQHNII